MQSGLKHTQTSKPSARNLQRVPATGMTQSYPCLTLSVAEHNCFARRHRRAWSAPPEMCAVKSRDRHSGIGEELRDEKHILYRFIDTDTERDTVCSHFYHADFEVIARNLSEYKSHELRDLLSSFALSVEPDTTLLSNTEDPCKCRGSELVRRRSVEHALPSLCDPRTTNKVSPLVDHFASTSPSLQQTRCVSCMDIAFSRTCASCRRKIAHEMMPQLPARTDTMLPLAKPHCDSSGHHGSTCNFIDDSDSASSVDFLHYARQRDPGGIRLLEEEYENMMK